MLAAAPAFAAEAVTYEKDIKGIIAKRCLFCHGPKSPTMEEFHKDKEGYKKKMKGLKLDTYANLMVVVKGSDAGALMRRLDDGKSTKDGKPGNMYPNLGGTDVERAANLEIFKKWIGNWTLKRSKELSKEELEAIKAPRNRVARKDDDPSFGTSHNQRESGLTPGSLSFTWLACLWWDSRISEGQPDRVELLRLRPRVAGRTNRASRRIIQLT